MKSHKVVLYGKSNDKGALKMNGQEVATFIKQWPNDRFMITIEAMPKMSSQAIRTYYYKKIIPEFVGAYREKQGEFYTCDTMDEMLLKMYKPNHIEIPKEETGGYELVKIRSMHELSNSEASAYLLYLKQVASENFGLYIDDNTVRELAQE